MFKTEGEGGPEQWFRWGSGAPLFWGSGGGGHPGRGGESRPGGAGESEGERHSGPAREREEKERDRRMRYDLHQSLSRLPTYDDADEDKEDKRALGKDRIQHTLVEDLEEEDPDLDAFNELDPAERLHKLVLHLREEYNYCFWCKFTYPDKDMEGCPGLTEEDHD